MKREAVLTTVNGACDDDGSEEYLTIGRSLDGCFEFGDRIYVVSASEYERLKAIDVASVRAKLTELAERLDEAAIFIDSTSWAYDGVEKAVAELRTLENELWKEES